MLGIGFLRFFLALCILLAHTYPSSGFQVLGGPVATESFFMISGFFIAMVLTTKYRSYLTFITNRVIRVYPAYYAVLMASMAVSWAAHIVYDSWSVFSGFAHYFWGLDLPWKAFFILTNAVILGQDLYFFLDIGPDGLPTVVWGLSQMRVMGVVPTAWALSLIVTFYLVAPFLNRRSTVFLVALLCASLASRMLFVWGGAYADPWTYRFFPNELALFIAGMLSFRWYGGGWLTAPANRWAVPATLSFMAYAFAYDSLSSVPDGVRWAAYFILLFVSLPFFYVMGRGSGLDAYLGRLAFPIFLSHYMIGDLLALMWLTYGVSLSLAYFASLVAILSILAGVLIIWCVEGPFDRLRQVRAQRDAGTS